MAVAGWTRPDMLMRYTKAQASARAADEAAEAQPGRLRRYLALDRCHKAGHVYAYVTSTPDGLSVTVNRSHLGQEQ